MIGLVGLVGTYVGAYCYIIDYLEKDFEKIRNNLPLKRQYPEYYFFQCHKNLKELKIELKIINKRIQNENDTENILPDLKLLLEQIIEERKNKKK